jgi:hypothetical protein
MENEENRQPLETSAGLPPWAWNLRASWTATKAYQTIRDAITDWIIPPTW